MHAQKIRGFRYHNEPNVGYLDNYESFASSLKLFHFITGDRQVYAEVTWEKPLNLDHIPHKSVIYEVVAQADLFGDSGI
jgi:hypothetical protein